MKNFNAITHAHVWVLDHQEALDFYVGKLGLEVKADYTLDCGLRDPFGNQIRILQPKAWQG